jgi:hypothetical protein
MTDEFAGALPPIKAGPRRPSLTDNCKPFINNGLQAPDLRPPLQSDAGLIFHTNHD